jgi:hypothetical protein
MAIGESINVDDLRVIDACLCCTCMLYTKPGCIGCSGKSQCCCVINETCCKVDKICNDCVPGLGISAFGIGCPCCLGCGESPTGTFPFPIHFLILICQVVVAQATTNRATAAWCGAAAQPTGGGILGVHRANGAWVNSTAAAVSPRSMACRCAMVARTHAWSRCALGASFRAASRVAT